MISHDAKPSNAWMPAGFSDCRNYYANTPWPLIPAERDFTDTFIAAWGKATPPSVSREIAIALTPGLFSEWLPGCFADARRAFRSAGHRVICTPVKSSRSVASQAKRLSSRLTRWLQGDEKFIWCGHSKGGLELLHVLESNSRIRAQCLAAIVVQPPVGISHVLKHFASEQASISERLTSKALATPLFADGVRDISPNRHPELPGWLKDFSPRVPTFNVVSWSVEPTSWIDSWHRTLGNVCPGIAHDGQFLTHEQILPATRLIALPAIDHAQPVLGGNGFDAARFWHTLVYIAAEVGIREAADRLVQTR